MNCSICFGIPTYFCPCAKLLLCNNDLEAHRKTSGLHNPSALQPLANDQSSKFILQLASKIELIEKAKSKILVETKNLINLLTSCTKSALYQLETLHSQCHFFLKSKIIYSVYKGDIEKIIETSIELPVIEPLLSYNIKTVFNDINLTKNNDINDWPLEQKLDYVKKKMSYTKLVSDNIKFSNDGKYVFNCKIHEGKREEGMDKQKSGPMVGVKQRMEKVKFIKSVFFMKGVGAS